MSAKACGRRNQERGEQECAEQTTETHGRDPPKPRYVVSRTISRIHGRLRRKPCQWRPGPAGGGGSVILRTHGASLPFGVRFEPKGQFGPGKAELLEKVLGDTGSIRSAAAAMKMSYRTAWLLLAELDEMFGAPVIARSTGGAKGGGAARLTELGKTLIRRFRSIEKRTATQPQRRYDPEKALTRLRRVAPVAKRENRLALTCCSPGMTNLLCILPVR